MLKKLTKHGNSLALVIDRPILELLNIDTDTPLDISTDGRRLIVAPADCPNGDRSSRRLSKPRTSVTAEGSRNWLSSAVRMEPLFLTLDEALEIHFRG